MRAIKSFFGYTLAFIGIPFALITFIGLNAWAKQLVNGTGLKISPWFSGGEISRSVNHGSYETRIYKPVFDGLIGQRKEGFVQVDWRKKASVPAQIDELVDIDGDGKSDFRLQWNTRSDTILMTPSNPAIIGLQSHNTLNDRYVARVELRNANP